MGVELGRVLKGEAIGIKADENVTTVAVKMVGSTSESAALDSLVSELKIMIHLGSYLNVVNLMGACTNILTKGIFVLTIV